jgi:hypothetical protein
VLVLASAGDGSTTVSNASVAAPVTDQTKLVLAALTPSVTLTVTS